MEHTYICMYINAVVNSVWFILIITVFRTTLYKDSVLPRLPPKLLGAHLILSHDSASLLPFVSSLFSFLLVKCIHLAAPWRSVVLTRLSKSTKASSVGASTKEDTLWKDSGCWAVLESGKTFLVPAPDRTTDTLMIVVSAWMVCCTTVISDCWVAYQDLEAHGYTPHTLNHSISFIDERGLGLIWTRLKERGGKLRLSLTPTAGRGNTYIISPISSSRHDAQMNSTTSSITQITAFIPHSTSKMSPCALNLPHTRHHASTPLHLYWARKKHASATSHSRDPRTNGTYFLSVTNTD